MKREVIRVEPRSTYLERVRVSNSPAIRRGETACVSGLRLYETLHEALPGGSRVVDETSAEARHLRHIREVRPVNVVYTRDFPKAHPHAFIDAPAGFGPFDIEIDCIAAVETK